jgi:hypothetical protein
VHHTRHDEHRDAEHEADKETESGDGRSDSRSDGVVRSMRATQNRTRPASHCRGLRRPLGADTENLPYRAQRDEARVRSGA